MADVREASQRAVLSALFLATGGRNSWHRKSGWNTEAPLRLWHGVSVENGCVVKLDLGSNELLGTIPPELGQLSTLTVLGLENNRLSGSIPPEIGQLTNLTRLELYSNQLSGTIPPELGQLSSLIRLDLRFNQLSGTIPPELGQLSNLRTLYLRGYQLSEEPSIEELRARWQQALIVTERTAQADGGGARRAPYEGARDFGVGALGSMLQERDGEVAALRARLLESDTKVAELEEQLRLTVEQLPNHTTQQDGKDFRLFSTSQMAEACRDFADAGVLLGRGGFGAVYRGNGAALGLGSAQEVAVKMLDADSLETVVTNFRKEVRVLTMCQHENLVPLLGVCLDPSSLVYPLMRGGSLDAYLPVRATLQGGSERVPLSAPRRLGIVVGVARALMYLHSEMGEKPVIIHRDVKPHNILLEEVSEGDGGGISASLGVRLGDVGIAQVSSGMTATTGTTIGTGLAGTFLYMDRDYIDGGDPKCEHDVYSLGVVMLELVMGKLVLAQHLQHGARQRLISDDEATGVKGMADSVISWTGEAPPLLQALAIMAYRCTQQDPEARPSLNEIVQTLAAALGRERRRSAERVEPVRDRRCIICMDAAPHTRFLPCLHSCTCHTCGTRLQSEGRRCPLCNTNIHCVEEGHFDSTF